MLLCCNPIQDNRRILVTGTIVNSTNQPLSDVDVLVLNNNRSLKIGEASTDENGFFRSVSLMPTNAVAVEFVIPEEVDIPERFRFLRRRTIIVEQTVFDVSKSIDLPTVRVSALSDVTIRLYDTSGSLDLFFYRYSGEIFSSSNFRIGDAYQLENDIVDSENTTILGSSNAINGIFKIEKTFLQNQFITFEYIPANPNNDEWQEVILEINENTHEFEIFF